MRREACRIPPASTDFNTKGTGARDVAIWLSLIREAARSTETVFLVSSDKKAFKASGIVTDLDDSGASVVVVNDIGELLDLLADDVDVLIDTSLIENSELAKEKISIYLKMAGILPDVLSAATEFPTGTGGSSYGDNDLIEVLFIGVEDIHGHVIGAETWVTGRVRWRIAWPVQVKWFRREERPASIPVELWRISFQVVSVLLFKTSADGIENVEILDVTKPSQITGQAEGFI